MWHVANSLAAFPCKVRALWTVKCVSDLSHEPTLDGVKAKLALVHTLNLE